jgi:hypothetical protein
MMRRPWPSSRTATVLLGLAALALGPSVAFAQQSPAVVIRRATGDSTVLDAAALARLPRHEVRGSDHGRAAVFTGVWMRDALGAAGVRTDSLRGPALAMVIVVEAIDGYHAAFSLGELAPDLGGRTVLLADRRDGTALGPTEGPYPLVLPEDGRAARWVRQVRSVSVIVPAAGGRPPAECRPAGWQRSHSAHRFGRRAGLTLLWPLLPASRAP